MSGHWVTLQTYLNSAEAHLARSVLEQHQIMSILSDEHMAMTHSAGIGGVKLKVAPGDLEIARQILKMDGEPV